MSRPGRCKARTAVSIPAAGARAMGGGKRAAGQAGASNEGRQAAGQAGREEWRAVSIRAA